MIVATLTWTHREKRSRRDREWLGSTWYRRWQVVPWDAKLGSLGCRISSNGLGFNAVIFGGNSSTVCLGWFELLEEAQTACDLAAEKHFGVDLDVAIANWREWTRTKRAEALAARVAKSTTPVSPEAIERSRKLIEELDEAGGRR